MANQTVYPYGTGGSLPSNIGVVNDVYTGGADKALSAEAGKRLNAQINDITDVDLSDFNEENIFINNSTGKWQVSVGYTGIFLPVIPGERYLLAPNSNGSAYALLTDNTYSDGGTPAYVDGGSRINFASFKIVTVPEDGRYLYIITHSNVDMAPTSAKRETSKLADADFSEIMPYNINLDEFVSVRAYPSNEGKWVTDSDSYPYYGVFISCKPNQRFSISSNIITRYCFLESDSHVKGANVSYASGYSGNPSQLSRGTATVTAPADASFLYIVSSVDGLSSYVLPSILRTDADTVEQIVSEMDTNEEEKAGLLRIAETYGNTLRKLEYNLDGNGMEIPDTVQVLNVLKKAAQFSEIKWTPKASVPKSISGSFTAGVTQTGLPYSSCKELDKEIDVDVSLHTFMTAVNNPYSLLYTENVRGADSQSAWGKTYHGAGHVGAYYGTVCTVLSAMCTGFKTDYITNAYKWLADTYRTVKIYDQSAQGLQLGDIIWKSGHCRVITGLKRNENGAVTGVAFTESIEELAKETFETSLAFDTRLVSESAIIYRPLQLYKNIDYVPSPYVPLTEFGETEETVTYNNDICCFAGDKATFREGDTIAVNYNLASVGSWTTMEIYKDGTILDTITLDASVHVVDLTSSNLAHGMYKARLYDGNTYSDFTYWEVLNPTVTFKVFGGKVDVMFSADNAKAVECRLGTQTGGVYAQHVFTEKEVAEGRAFIDFVKLNREQGFSIIKGKNTVLLKVFFKGEYGRVTNVPASIYFE